MSSQTERLCPTVLHGVLEITIHEAKGLPNKDRSLLRRNRAGDPYVLVFLNKFRIVKTSTFLHSLNPDWEEKFTVDVVQRPANFLHFSVMGKGLIRSDDRLGSVKFEVEKLLKEGQIIGTFGLCKEDGTTNGATLKLDVQYKPVPTEALVTCTKAEEVHFMVN